MALARDLGQMNTIRYRGKHTLPDTHMLFGKLRKIKAFSDERIPKTVLQTSFATGAASVPRDIEKGNFQLTHT